MVNPGTFRGLRLEFLNAQNDNYAAAAKSGDVDAFVMSTQRRYFKRFPITLDHNTDPTQEWLDQVDDNAPEDEIKAPDSNTLPPEEYALALATHEALMLNLKKRKDSIKRRLQYRYAKTRGEDEAAAVKGALNSLDVLTAKLMGKHPSKPRMKTPYNLWGPQHRDITDPVFKARVTEDNVPASQQLALRSLVYKELFEKLPKSEQEDWAERAEEDHFNALAEHKSAMTGPPSTEPQDRQRVITAIPKLIAPILDLVAAYTGWQWSLMGGGPEPADDGRLNMLSVHSGVMPGTVRMDFGRAERQAYREHIQPIFGRYLTRCYTVEECRSRALPRHHAEIPLASIAEEEDFDHRHFDRNDHVKLATSKTTPNHARGSKDAHSGKPSKNSRTANETDARSKTNGLTKEACRPKAAPKESRSTSNTSNESREADSALKDPQSTGIGSSSTKIGPPRGKKPQCVAPVGAKHKHVAPTTNDTGEHTPPCDKQAHKTTPTSTDIPESARLVAVADVGEPGGAGNGSDGALTACRAATSMLRSSSQPPSSSTALAGTITTTRRAASQPIAPSNGPSRTPAPIGWKHKSTSARSMSMAPPRASSQAPPLVYTPPPSRASSRGPSPPPSRAPSCGPSLPPSHSLSRSRSLSPSRVLSRGPLPTPSTAQQLNGTSLSLSQSATTSTNAASAAPLVSTVPTALTSTMVATSITTSTVSPPASATVAPPASPTVTPPVTATVTPLVTATVTPPVSAPIALSAAPVTTSSASTTPAAAASVAPRRIPSGAAAVPDNNALDAALGNDGMSRKRTGRGVVTALKETEGNPKRKIPTEASKPRKRGRGEDGAPVVPCAFEVPVPSDCPEWVEKAVLLLTAEDLGSDWRGLVIAWLKFEESSEFVKSGPSLPTSHRPTAISSWIQRARRPNFRPNLNNLRDFEDSFWSWWKALQPDWRSDDDSGVLKCPEGGDWDVLRISGQNGLLSVVAALCFWGIAAAGSSPDVERWSAAVTDVHYALRQLIT